MTHEAQTRLPWTAEEDAILISLVERYGEKRWNMVANGLPGRTGKGCSHRWRTYLRPDVKHPHLEPFTEWEAAVIVQSQREMGNNWLAIAKLLLPGRSNTAVKNFWHCRLKSGSGTNTNRFIVEGYGLRFLLSEVPHEERIHPVALPAFPSTAPTGQLHHHKQEQHMADLNQLAHDTAMMSAAAAAAGDTSAFNVQGYPTGVDSSAVDMTGQSMGLNPTTGGLAAGLNPNGAAAAGQNSGGVAAAGLNPTSTAQVGVPPPDPSLDPKEDLKRRASVYVQQQLTMMGQPIRAGGSSSCRRDSAHAGSSSHNVGGTGCGLDPHGWPGQDGVYGASGLGYSTGATGYKKGSGRGRGRRPGQRNRHSSDDDPNDETYVPSGRYVKAEQAISRDDVTTRHSEPSAGGSTMTHAYVHGASSSMGHGMAGSSGMMQQMMAHSMAAGAGEYHYAMHGMHHQQHYDTDYAAVAAMAHHHISDGGGVTSSHQQQQHGAGGMTAAAAPADLAGLSWQNQNVPYSMQGMPPSQSAAAGPSNSSHTTSYPPSQTGGISAAATTTAAGGPGATAIAVAAAAHRTSLLGLEDTAVAYEAFRQSGGDFKISIGCLDDFLSGVSVPNPTGGDWNPLNGVAGLLRVSLDGSRFSLTGSADAAGMSHDPRRQSTRGAGLEILPQQQQQQHKQHHLDMPPPRCHPSHAAASHGPTSQPAADQCQPGVAAAAGPQQGRPIGLEIGKWPSSGHTQVTSGPIHPDTTRSADHMVTQGPTQAPSQASTADGLVHPVIRQMSDQPGVTQGPTQDVTKDPGHSAVTQGPIQSGVTQDPAQPGVTQGPGADTSRCQSPFKAAALQQTPFSPLMDGCAAAAPAGLHSTQTAPSSQPTQCSAGQIVGHLQQDVLGHQGDEQHLQQLQADSSRHAAARMTQRQQTTQGLPATFHSVLQALGGPSSSTAVGATGNSSNQPAAVRAVTTAPTAASSEVAVKAEPGTQARLPPASAVPHAGLQLHCTGDALRRHSRASYGLLSPMGNIFADATGGCLTLDDAIGSSYNCYNNHSNTDDNPQSKAERRSLRLLLGVLANTPGEHQQHDPAAWSGHAATAVDSESVHAADDLTFMRRSSHGGCLGGASYINKPTSGSSRRPSLSIVPHTGRASQQNLEGNNKRRRVSALLTSPVGTAAKRSRVSFAGGVVGRTSSGTAEYDDCLSYWQN